MFKIGQEVVCVDTDGLYDCGFSASHLLKKGEIYVIRWIDILHHPIDAYDGILCVRVSGVERPASQAEINGGWTEKYPHLLDMPLRATRFRPLKKTDISVFTAMLVPVKGKNKKVDA